MRRATVVRTHRSPQGLIIACSVARPGAGLRGKPWGGRGAFKVDYPSKNFTIGNIDCSAKFASHYLDEIIFPGMAVACVRQVVADNLFNLPVEAAMRTRTNPVHHRLTLLIGSAAAAMLIAGPACADPFSFSTGNPDGKIATASRPDAGGLFEIESADDFVLTGHTSLTSATFTGLVTSATGTTPTIGEVRVEIYQVFPKSSDVGRTSGPPTFSTSQVPTRVNSPSDVALDDRDSTSGGLTFMTTGMGTFTASNSVQPGGIHPTPGQTTGGNGFVTGIEVVFTITFTNPFVLPADHYFFIPQVEVTGGQFLWLSAPRPIVPPGTPFPPGFTDLQSWTRDAALDPDWLRVGGDIVGPTPATGPTFNAAFSLTGTVPEPGTLLLIGAGTIALWWRRKRST